jgi:hypothetical protein
MAEPTEEMQDAQEDAQRFVDAIEKLSLEAQALNEAGLSRRALVVLLHDQTRVAKRDINLILNALPQLAEHFLDAGD